MSDLTPEAIYAQLKELAASQPDLSSPTAELAQWLGRLHDAVGRSGDSTDAMLLRVVGDSLTGDAGSRNRIAVQNILYRALAKMERVVPDEAQGGFIAAGDVFEALAVMSRALSTAQRRALIVDPYMAPEVLMNYAPMLPEGVQIDLLGGDRTIKPGLEPAAKAWIKQYGESRPLRARTIDSRILHDRLLIVDDAAVWDISQSLNALATRSHATIAKSNAEQATMKVAAYVSAFDSGAVLVEGA